MRTCPQCGKERPETGGAFCGSHCEARWNAENVGRKYPAVTPQGMYRWLRFTDA